MFMVPEGEFFMVGAYIVARGRSRKSKDHMSMTHRKQREKSGNEARL